MLEAAEPSLPRRRPQSDRDLALRELNRHPRGMSFTTVLRTLSPLALIAGACLVTELTGCAEPQDPDDKDAEIRESDSKDSSGNDGNASQEASASMMHYSAGSRLEPVLIEASDGAKQFYGWYDSKLELSCSFSMRSASTLPNKDEPTMRCLPAMATINNQNYFQDNSCTEQVDVLLISECADTDRLKYGQIPTTTCGEEPVIHELKSIKPLSTSDVLWHNLGTRDCSIVTNAQIVRMAETELGSKVKPSTFVSAKAVK